MAAKIPVTVWGATGFTGGELMRILARHPGMEAVGAISRGSSGTAVGAVHPHLRHAYPDMTFISPEQGFEMKADAAFLALPHRSSAETARRLLDCGVKVVDLSADFRLKSASEYKRWYEVEHPCPELLGEAVYGLPELHRGEMGGARLISGVGCNAASAIFALTPIARAGLIEEARIECRVGSSESGAHGGEGSSHPLRSRTLRVVSPFVHRHMAELTQELGVPEDKITMGVTAVELVRGIQCVAHVKLNRPLREADLWKLYRGAWGGERFVSTTPAKPAHFRIPDPRFVLGSNRVLTGFILADDGTRLIAASAIDNLMKGAAGSAVQSANIISGLEETSGLDMMPVYPA
ncbi:MAG: N-acetyl-gamma-glutamyl-phosphate reductase [Synergistaceae bacterium]|jgi:N-acetyl-gamma-glutamyl-phosphate/LysW-gamma-L-alpha-aminoadipyl-6-phosphate reductase|nr:N-acetyl-gamma-glutamyl-phosphate reductase [Synergistaceae bacterium]